MIMKNWLCFLSIDNRRYLWYTMYIVKKVT